MHLKIAFIGYNNSLTRLYLRQLAADNVEQVLRFDARGGGRVFLKDGTVIEGYLSDHRHRDGTRYDQVFIADDRRLEIIHKRAMDLAYLRLVCAYSSIPEEYKFQFYDVDAEGQNHRGGRNQ